MPSCPCSPRLCPLSLLLALAAVPTLARAGSGPIREERGPVAFLDSFEADKPAYTTWNRGKLKVTLKPTATPARHGKQCLTVELRGPYCKIPEILLQNSGALISEFRGPNGGIPGPYRRNSGALAAEFSGL